MSCIPCPRFQKAWHRQPILQLQCTGFTFRLPHLPPLGPSGPLKRDFTSHGNGAEAASAACDTEALDPHSKLFGAKPFFSSCHPFTWHTWNAWLSSWCSQCMVSCRAASVSTQDRSLNAAHACAVRCAASGFRVDSSTSGLT